MTPEKQELMRRAAQNLLDHEKAGRKCDPLALQWARNITRQSPRPQLVRRKA
jgi:hypothetical protein